MFKKMYMLLFNSISDAIDALDRGDDEQGRAILICAQQEAEELYLERTEQKADKVYS